ncbi:MAG TPA: AraC family transcriptional regulator [Planctomycetota bacterium]|nr:AraC family transcriptional regulator [Planctomycetota bacterium]
MGYLYRMEVGGLQVYTVAVNHRADVEIAEHHHAVFELIYLLEGAMRIRIRGRQHRAGVGDLVIYHPGEDHRETYLAGRWSAVVLRFEAPRLGRGVRFPSRDTTPPVVHLPRHERFRQLFEAMQLDARVRDSWTEAMSRAYLVQFAVLLHRALAALGRGRRGGGSPADERSARIAGAMEIIRDGLGCGLSVRDLARKTAMSESAFSHLFKNVAGIPPRRYQIQERVARARELLETTSLSVKEIAAELGYDDVHYFSRVFRKLTGRTPSGVRGGRRQPVTRRRPARR